MSRVSLAVALLALSVPSASLAQQGQQEEAPPTLRLSFYQCHQNRIDEVLEEVEKYDIPIWQELVREGMVMNYGYFTHAWAGEYNLGLYTIARDIPAVIAASEEAGRRAEERFPDASDLIGEVCPWHRDAFYVLGPSVETGEEGGGN